MPELVEALSQAGVPVTSSRVRQHLTTIGVRLHGTGTSTTYSLKGARGQTAAASSNGHSNKLPILLDVLEKHDGPMAIEELSAAVREAGYTGGLTGIAGYVKLGYLTRTRGGKYAFKARPEAAAEAEAE